MKKALLFFALAFIVTTAWSQSSDSNFRFGVKVQPALAWFRVDAPDEVNLESDGLPFGFGYGLITDFKFTERYAFSTGVEIAYRGGKLKYSYKDTAGTSTTVKNKLSLQFIEIPLTLKLRTNEIGYMTYFFQVGVAPGYAIRTRGDITVNDKLIEENEDISGQINEFNLSMIIGAGAEYNLSGSTSLLFGLTFNNGFLDLLDDKNYNGEVKGNSNYLALMLGVLF
jgi:opacity protein-like surface antigen